MRNHIGRREFITLLSGTAAAWSVSAQVQQPTMPVVGFLRDATAESSSPFIAGLRKGLTEAGFVEGRNLAIDYALTGGQTDRLPALATDLVRRRVAVIVASGTNPTIAAKTATSTIPVVFAIVNDPVASGLVASPSRPGGNLTGVSYLTTELAGKRLGLIREILPKITDFAVLAHPKNPTSAPFIHDAEAAARAVGLQMEVFNATTEAEIDPAFLAATARRKGALLVASNPLYTTLRERIVALAARHAVPAIYNTREFAEAGGLLSYGSNIPEVYRLAGGYVGRILKGDKPADLPVIQPTKLELVINLKAAKALGIEIPPLVRAIADEVIE